MGSVRTAVLGALIVPIFVGCTTYRPLLGQPDTVLQQDREVCSRASDEVDCMKRFGYEATTTWDWLELFGALVDAIPDR